MITVTAHGLKETRQKLIRAKRDLERRQPAHQKIKKRQVKRWRQQYQSEGAEYGGWAALALSTLEERARFGYGAGPILRRSGGTYRSAVNQAQAGNVTDQSTQWIFRNQGGGMRGGPYPLSHHTGYPNPMSGRRPIPARPVWPIDGKDEAEAAKIMEQYVDEVIARYF